jgi:3-oxoacyl-[acyl-carrier protein] reductase
MIPGCTAALVSGASKGIGRACALKLARRGYNVAVNYLRDELGALRTVELINELGRKGKALRCDVSSFESARQLVEETENEVGSLGVLVCNAGITRDGLLMRMPEEDWDTVLTVNLKGVFNLCKWASRAMMKRKAGRIINISSVVALTGNIGQVNYCASKAGIIGLTRALAKELSRYSITANVVAPGYILTDMTGNLPDHIKEKIIGAIPLKRFGVTQDVADAVGFLASPQASYITGHVMPVDGGMSLGSLT